MAYYAVPITRHHAGFGLWQAGNAGDADDWQGEDDLVQAIYDDARALGHGTGACLELGVDALPDDIEDIRGKVGNEPERIFVLYYDDPTSGRWVQYIGVSERE